MVQEVLKNWKISFGTRNSILLLQGCLTLTSYLMGDAKRWWRTRYADDVCVGRPRIDTWHKLIKVVGKADGFGEKAKG